jgi:hypothetical protein
MEEKTRFTEDSVKMILDGPLSSKDPVMRVNGIMHLVNLGPRGEPFIVDRLNGIDPGKGIHDPLIMGCIQALGLMSGSSSHDAIIGFLQPEKGPVEKEMNDHIIRACIRIGSAGSMSGIINRSLEVQDIERFEDFEERFASIMMDIYPDDIPDDVESEVLKILSMDLSKEARLRVINIISILDDVEMLESLLTMFPDAEVEIRREIIKMIFQRRALDYKEHLIMALEDLDEEVQALAIYGLMISDRSIGLEQVKGYILKLGKMSGKIPVMKEAESLISSHLIRMGKEAEPMLYDMIKGADTGTRNLANKLLERMQ